MNDEREDKLGHKRDLEQESRDERESEVDLDEDYESEEEFEESQESSGHQRGQRAKNADTLITQEIPARAAEAHDLLRSKLRGKIQIKVKGVGSYHLDWSNPELIVKKNHEAASDTQIEIEERDLLKVTTGGLNPQIGMLSDKINVSGNPEMAIYFFNLISR